MNRLKIIILSILFCTAINAIGAQNKREGEKREFQDNEVIAPSTDSLKWSISTINNLLNNREWYLTEANYKSALNGLLHHIIDNPIDTSIVELTDLSSRDDILYLFDRNPDNIIDRRSISGYITEEEQSNLIKTFTLNLRDSLEKNLPNVPQEIIGRADLAAERGVLPTLAPLEYFKLTQPNLSSDFKIQLHEAFAERYNTDEVELTPALRDSIRGVFIGEFISEYNRNSVAKIKSNYIDSVTTAYQKSFTDSVVAQKSNDYLDDIKLQNREILYSYNDKMVNVMNDQAISAIEYLSNIAKRSPAKITLDNGTGGSTSIWTDNVQTPNRSRLFLKNAQNDSIQVILQNGGKGVSKIFVDDIANINRFNIDESSNRGRKEIKIKDSSIVKVETKDPEKSPWTDLAVLYAGLTQTSLTNWAAGGESSYSGLLTGRYDIKYKTDEIAWDSYADLRLGAVKQADDILTKTDDKLELNSRLGLSAGKEWYYTGDLNFKTQFAKGYTNQGEDDEEVVSKWMAPGYITFTVGMDYKPTKTFSLYASPIGVKGTFVNDTVMVEQTRYSIEEDKKAFWEPGLSLKSTYTKEIMENINGSTNIEFFTNYLEFMKRINFVWGGSIDMQVNQYIKLNLMCNLIYDTQVLFDTDELDLDGNTVTETRVQFKEAFTFGFTYTIY